MRAGEHDGIAIGITQPAFPVGVLTAMPRFDHIHLQLLTTSNRGIEVVEFKPEENAVSVWPKLGIPERTMMVFDLPFVQLNQGSVRDQTFIVRPAVPALAAKEALIPPAARFDVMHANEGL